MIARIWHGRTPADKADEYLAYIEETGIKELRQAPGNQGDFVLRKVDEAKGTADFLVISLWDSMENVRGFAGDNADVPVYYPKDEKYLLELEKRVEHYEAPVHPD